jgi:OOP family OmpA-OmpF porin
MGLGMMLLGFMVREASALEIITEEDVQQAIVTNVNLVKAADNAIILFDSSSSMAKPLEGTSKPRLETLKELLLARLAWLPDLGYNFGLYLFTPWTEIYPIQPFDREKLRQAIQQLPTKAAGQTLLIQAMANLEPILEGLSGRTVVFLFSDGQYLHHRRFKKPYMKARELAQKHNVCFYIVSTAETKQHEKTLQEIADVNECSRVIRFANYMKRPGYNSGALFVVDAKTELVTVTEQKMVGVKGENILFGFDSLSIPDDYKDELDAIGEFVKITADSYIVMHGYADNTGSAEYNMKLSRRRAETVADYLTDKFGIDRMRMLIMWYGDLNPIASNDTPEGRRLNRRVEIAVGLE